MGSVIPGSAANHEGEVHKKKAEWTVFSESRKITMWDFIIHGALAFLVLWRFGALAFWPSSALAFWRFGVLAF